MHFIMNSTQNGNSIKNPLRNLYYWLVTKGGQQNTECHRFSQESFLTGLSGNPDRFMTLVKSGQEEGRWYCPSFVWVWVFLFIFLPPDESSASTSTSCWSYIRDRPWIVLASVMRSCSPGFFTVTVGMTRKSDIWNELGQMINWARHQAGTPFSLGQHTKIFLHFLSNNTIIEHSIKKIVIIRIF